MSQLLLPSLEIKGFRGFQHLRIENLQRVNLIVGKNSVGKTSLLEALWLYASDWNKYVESGILRERNEERQAHYDPKELDYNNSVRHLFFNRPTLSSNNPLEISIGSVESPMTFSIDTGARNGTPRAHIIIPVGGLSPHEIEQAWDAIALTERQDYLLEALRIIEPSIADVNMIASQARGGTYAGRRVPFVRMNGTNIPVPLRSVGEGMMRMFVFALALANADNGFLLVDEIESGIHYSVQPDMWQLIFRIAQQLNIQVFATTHSWDCIEGFQNAVAKEGFDDGLVVRLEKHGDEVTSTLFDARRLSIATNELIEIR
ncbi:MAG: AAA family ATPase [Chlorobi bacterium]|nr:AAA family ATPase [Chlorobiota bacterium]